MKRINLSIQVTFVFVAAFIITSFLVVFSVTKSVEATYEDIVYQKLEAEAKAIAQTSTANDFLLESDMAVIQYASESQSFLTSENIDDYADESTIALLIGKAAQQEISSQRYTNIINGKQVFYVVLKHHGFFEVQSHDVFIVLTDDTMKSKLMEDMRSNILSIFFVSFVLGYFIVLLWIFKLVKDTKYISSALKSIGSNYYKAEIETQRKDEIGDLVSSIEAMREKIAENEKQKQEIIQGVSHDLKTPIAVIRSYGEALKDGLCEPNEVSEVVESECIRLDKKVSELLNLTRLNYIDMHRESFGEIRMDLLIEDIVKRYHHMTKAQFKLDLKPVSFFGERESWRVALQCLLDNAIRYAEKQIKVSLKKDFLHICNDGPHIEEDRLANIFIAYEKSADGNYGIGLATVRRTAELFGYRAVAKNCDDGVCFELHK